MPDAKRYAKEKANRNKQLEEGAKKIRKARVEAGPLQLTESDRPIQDILRERVTILPESIGLELADDTPIEESLRVLDWANTMNNHVGFMIGDVLNFGKAKFGEKYQQALNITGRAYSTLAGYAEAAKHIPKDKRVAALSFSHHREILRIGDDAKIDKVLKEAEQKAKDGRPFTSKELRVKIAKLIPKKKKGKAKTKRKSEPPYEPNAEEQAKIDEFEESLNGTLGLLTKGVKDVLLKVDNKVKRRFIGTLLPFTDFREALDKVTD